MDKNTAGGSFEVFDIEPGFQWLRTENQGVTPWTLSHITDRKFLQIHFCLKGHVRFLYNEDRYTLDLNEAQSLLLYNPQTDLPIRAMLSPESWLISMIISIRTFHALFTADANYISFLNPENRDHKYYHQEGTNPAMAVILTQLWNLHIHPSVQTLYCRGKAYELLSLLFNRTTDATGEQCPFLVDGDNLRRIRRAKEIVVERMAEPPGLAALADEIGLSLKKLKEGFRQVYGDSVYSFLFDYKMETARKMLESGSYNVNEVGLKVGYSTASHFIEAFRKKYNTTPKKYLMAMSQQGA
jgi:AraC-like DNA-binding protein